jgi:Mn-containing catalase
VQSEIKGGEGLTVTPYEPQPGTEVTSPIDSTPVGQWTNGVGEKQKALHEAKEIGAAESASVEV